MTVHVPQEIRVQLPDGTESVTTSFQLIQWKFALRLEKVGMTMSRGRKVSTHLRKIWKLKRSVKIEQLEEMVQAILDNYADQIREAS